MNKQALYQQLPRLILRLFTLGLGSAIVFLFCWYALDGAHLWGRILTSFLDIFVDARYDEASNSVLYYFSAVPGQTQSSVYAINQLNSNMVVLVTLMATWPHTSIKNFLNLAAWCLLLTLLYQGFSVFIQTYNARIGPELAVRLGIFWEETFQYQAIKKLANFDKMILRFFAWLPVFIFSLVAMYFTGWRKGTAKAD